MGISIFFIFSITHGLGYGLCVLWVYIPRVLISTIVPASLINSRVLIISFWYQPEYSENNLFSGFWILILSHAACLVKDNDAIWMFQVIFILQTVRIFSVDELLPVSIVLRLWQFDGDASLCHEVIQVMLHAFNIFIRTPLFP